MATEVEQSNVELKEGIVKGVIKNTLPMPVFVFTTRNWNGVQVDGGYPPVILPNATKTFQHGQNIEFGAIGAVVYTTNLHHSADGPSQITILVAWHYSIRSSKVYVQVGRRETFEVINWPEIQTQLSKSGPESSHLDPRTRTSASAKLVRGGSLEINFG